MCSFLRSPGYWANYANHMSDAQFQAILAATRDYSGLGIGPAVSVLRNTRDQYHRFLLSAELSAAWNGDDGNAKPSGQLAVALYNNPAFPSSPLNGMTVDAINHLAFVTNPGTAGADLTAYLKYVGAGQGESDGGSQCRVTA